MRGVVTALGNGGREGGERRKGKGRVVDQMKSFLSYPGFDRPSMLCVGKGVR